MLRTPSQHWWESRYYCVFQVAEYRSCRAEFSASAKVWGHRQGRLSEGILAALEMLVVVASPASVIDKFCVAGKFPRSCLPQYFTSAMLGCAAPLSLAQTRLAVMHLGRKRKT